MTSDDLKDEYGNRIAEVLNGYGANVAVTLPLMAEYIQEKYKNLKIVWSTSTNYGENIWEKIKKNR